MKLIFTVLLGLVLSNAVISINIKEYQEAITKFALNVTFVREFEEHMTRILEIDPSYLNYNPYNSFLNKFNCPIIPPSENVKSVHELKISDIKAVAALGDSLTAAMGADAKTVLGLLFEYRGESWSAGGDKSLDELVTMPNIARKYNSNIVGFSTGKDFILSPFEKPIEHLNVAVSGQEANHIPEQARQLVKRLKESKDIDYQNDWKLVTLFIGGNDICDYCKDKSLHSPQAYIDFVQEGLDILFNELPKTFVNLVTVLRVTEVEVLNEGLICKLLHKFECPCAAFPENDEEKKELEKVFNEYVANTHALINSNRYERDDFTVVIQPFMEDMQIPRTNKGKADLSYFAPDCFHFSRKGHTQSSIALWNNMFTAVGSKKTSWDMNSQITCPSGPLCTRKNNC